MTGTSINISRENIAQAVENVTKLSREEIQKWRDFVNEELKKTDLDEKTKEKYQKYKAIFEKTSAQINSLQGEMPLQPIDKNTGTAPVSPAKPAESQSVSVSPEQQKKQKEEIEEYGQDVAVKLAEILVKDGEINQQGIKSAMELVNDLSQLKYKDNPDLNLKLEASELDVLKKVPHAVKGVVGSVFLSSLYANGYTVRFIGNEQVSLHKHKDAPVVRLGEGTDLTHSINNFIKGNPGFLEVLKAGLLFHSGDLAKYVDTNSSYGKLNAWTHNYRSFSQYLNKRTEQTLPGASMKESQDNLFNDEEFKNYLGVASVMPEDIVSVTKKLSENEKVKQLFKEWIATAGLAQTVPQAVRQTHTPEERAQIMGMHDNETKEEMEERFKKNPIVTSFDLLINEGLVRGYNEINEKVLNKAPSYVKWGIIAAVLFGMIKWWKHRKWVWGLVGSALIGAGLFEKANMLERAKYDIRANPNDLVKRVTAEQKQEHMNKMYSAGAKSPEQVQENIDFAKKFDKTPVGDIKKYIDKKGETQLPDEGKKLIDDHPEKAKLLRNEIQIFDNFIDEKIKKITPAPKQEDVNKVWSALDMLTLEQRRSIYILWEEWLRAYVQSLYPEAEKEGWNYLHFISIAIGSVALLPLYMGYKIYKWWAKAVDKTTKMATAVAQAAEATKEKATAAKNKITKTSSLEQGKAESYADHKNRLLETKSGLDQKITELEQQKALRTDKAGQDKIQTQINELEAKKANIDEKLSAREKIEPFPTKGAREQYEASVKEAQSKGLKFTEINLKYNVMGKDVPLTWSQALRIHQSYDYLKKFDGVSVKDPATMSEMVKHLQNIESVIREAGGWELKLVEKFAKTGKVPGVSTNKITEVKFNHAVLAKLIKR